MADSYRVVISLIAAVVVMVVGINAHISGSGHVVAPVNRDGATAHGPNVRDFF